MSQNSISVRVQPQSGRALSGQNKHDMRDPKSVPDYVDSDKSNLNSVIIAPPSPEALRAEIAANRAAAGQQKLRADSRTSIAGIITFGVEAQPLIAAMTRDDQDALYLKIAERLAKETARPLLGLVVHRDESAPHAHFVLRGYELRAGKEYAPRFDRRDLARLQDIAAEEVAHLGIERGTPKTEREARGESKAATVHRSVAQLHGDLPGELDEARTIHFAALRHLDSRLEDKRNEVAIKSIGLEIELKEAKAKLEEYQRLVAKAKKQLEQVAAGDAAADKLEKRIAIYESRIEKLKPPTTEPLPNRGLGSQEKIYKPDKCKGEVVMQSGVMGFGQKTEEIVYVDGREFDRYAKETTKRIEELTAENNKLTAQLMPVLREQMRQLDERMREFESMRKEARELGRSSRKSRDDYGLGD